MTERQQPYKTSRAIKEVSASDTMSEAHLQDAIIELGHVLGWEKIAHFRPALMKMHGALVYRTPVSADGKGFFDLLMANPAQRRIVAIECKSEKGKPSPEQLEWEITWRNSGGEYFLFRPSDWLNENIFKTLANQAQIGT